MQKVYLQIFLIILSFEIKSQSYSFQSYSSEYTELQDYESIALLTQGNFNWIYNFELNFMFPYYDEKYDNITCFTTGACDFDDTNLSHVALQLLSFGYSFDNLISYDIDSDVRFKLGSFNGLKALVIQFTKMRLWSDYTAKEFDRYINFQWWFLENGNIEIHFGPRNLVNSPVYVPGEGFYFIDLIDGPMQFGPYITLFNPKDGDEWVAINNTDNETEFNLVTDEFGIIRTLPPENWVLKFERSTVSNQNIEPKKVNIYPNPTKDVINIKSEELVDFVQVFSLSGHLIATTSESKFHVSNLPNGLYILKIHHNDSISYKKFFKT